MEPRSLIEIIDAVVAALAPWYVKLAWNTLRRFLVSEHAVQAMRTEMVTRGMAR